MTIRAQTGPGREPAIYVALRVADLPEPSVPSERLTCARCREAVWVDPLLYVPVRLREASLRVLCVPCSAILESRL